MIGDTQEQKVEGGSTAIQALRDVHYHGMSFTEVRELCTLLFHENFPKFREDARQTAEQYVCDFVQKLDVDLVNKAESIAFEKFRDPDVQSSINDAVQASGRKGELANPEILSTLITERVAKGSSTFQDTVIAEAVTVVPKLTSDQIALIAFTFAVRGCGWVGLRNIANLESWGQKLLINVRRGFDLSQVQKEHVVYAGACTISRLASNNRLYRALLMVGSRLRPAR